MRPVKFGVLSLLALSAMPVICAPAMADDFSNVQFVAGTGEVKPAARALPFADETAPRGNAAQEMNDIATKMADPHMQDGLAHMVESMTSAMMRLPVGQLAAAVEKASPGTLHKRIRSNATLADVAGNDARDLPASLAHKSRDMMSMMSGFTKAFAVMVPEFEKLGKEMEASFKDVKTSRR